MNSISAFLIAYDLVQKRYVSGVVSDRANAFRLTKTAIE
jgi:hypothetical protein